MKKQLLFLFAFLTTAMGFAQATATPPPPMLQCGNEVFVLNQQTPFILGTQSPNEYVVTYYTGVADANLEVNPIDPNFFITPQGAPVTVMARVDSLLDSSFALTSFYVLWDSAFVQDSPDVTACESYTLPALPNGNYFTAPNGGGSPINASDIITSTMTVYVFATSASGICTSEESFQVIILPASTISPTEDIYSCEAYVFEGLGQPNYQYQLNGAPIQLPVTITQNSVISVTDGMCGFDTFTVFIGQPAIVPPAPYIICNNDGNGYGVFDLNSQNAAMSGGTTGINFSFHETFSDANNGVNAIANASNYVNITPNNQVVFVRAQFEDDSCSTVVSWELLVTACTENVITGNIRFDYDNNGCSIDDPAAANIPVMCTNGNFTVYAYTNEYGDYTFTNIQQGNNLVAPLNVPMNFTVANPSSQTFDVLGSVNALTADFCLILANPVNDASVYTYPLNAARPGFAANYMLTVQNVGSTMLSGTVTVNFDNGKLTFTNATPPQASQTANTITFNYSNLMPLQNMYYYLTFNVATPPTASAGDILNFTSTVTTNATDAILANNTYTFNQTVVNSYDPNDIMVLEGAYITEEQADGFLNYIVRFQNTGTASAVNVKITNKLDANLDWATFTPIASSHSYQAERADDEVTFSFDDIMLPSNLDNEIGSHGFIAYRVKPIMDFAEGDIISNTANIFFDFNAPIVTNTVTTQIQTLGLPTTGNDAFTVHPNPASEVIYIRGVSSGLNVQVFDLQGKLISTELEISGSDASINISGLQSGLYLVKMTSEGRTTTKKLIVK